MAKALTNPSFDYGTVSKDEASKLRYFEGELARSRKRVADEAIKHGEILHQVQGLLANHSGGVFHAWLESSGISKGTAYNAISAYVEFASCPNLDNLEVSAMYALASHEKAKKQALKLASKGVKVTHAMAKQLIEEARSEEGKPGGGATTPTTRPPVSDVPASPETAAELPASGSRHEEDELVEGFGIAESPTTPGIPAGSETLGLGSRDKGSPDSRSQTGMPGSPACQETGEDVSLATEAAQELSPESSRSDMERTDAPGEDLARKNRNLAKSLIDKAARVSCDLHEVKPNRSRRDRVVALLQEAGELVW